MVELCVESEIFIIYYLAVQVGVSTGDIDLHPLESM